MNTKQKRYSLSGNIAWMVKICWETRRRALFLCLVMALCDILNNLVGLYIGPRVLGLVEAHSSLSQLHWALSRPGRWARRFSSSVRQNSAERRTSSSAISREKKKVSSSCPGAN